MNICLESFLDDKGYGKKKKKKQLSLEKEMATHSSVLAWEIPWTEEPGGLHFMGLQRDKNS